MTVDVLAERTAVVMRALSWVGVPFLHMGQDRAAGIDCAHLLLDAFAPLVAVDVTPYTADWFLHSDRELLRDMVRPHCVQVLAPEPGDIILFQFGRAASHAGIITDGDPLMMVHAYRPSRGVRVDECGVGSGFASRLDSCWRLSRWMA